MSTISKKIADDIIDGKYPEDECTKIITYNNIFDGGLTYAAVFKHENQLKYELSPACFNVKTYWLSD
jgi:hypothetical protein